MEPKEENQETVNLFGEPLDEKLLQNFAKVEKRDLESAVQWFDDNASKDWIGALDAPPFSPRNVVK